MATEGKEYLAQPPQEANKPAGTLITAEKQQLMAEVLGDTGAPSLHNFQGNAMEVWKQIARVSAGDCVSFDDVEDNAVEICHFFVHPVQFVADKGGEITGGIRTVLIPKEGLPFACVSDGVARDLSGIVRTFGFGPYDPPIRVQVVAVKTRKGRKTYRLVPMD